MSIKRLIYHTQYAKDEDCLSTEIEKAAEETKIVFAREIKELFSRGEYDKLAFLGIFYTEVVARVAKSCYNSILRDLEYDLVKAKDFDDLLEEFNEIVVWDNEGVGYVHSSYRDAFGSALVENNKPNNISKRIFSKVLLKLYEEDFIDAEDVARPVVKNFNKLPEGVRNELLLKLSENHSAAGYVAMAVAENFDKLPANLRIVLLKLSEKDDETKRHVVWAVARNFDKLPANVRNLLFTLSEDKEIALDIATAVAENFNRFPDEARTLLFKLSEKDGTARYVESAITRYFDELPEDVRILLLKLFEKDKDAWIIARNVIHIYDKLPKNVRNDLLIKLSEKDETAGYVIYIVDVVAEDFDKFPDDIKNLLFMLSEKEKAAQNVARAIAQKFDRLPDDLRNLLDRLPDKLQHEIEDLSSGNNLDKMLAMELISKAKSKIDKNFALGILDKISKDKNEKVRIKAEELIKSIREG